MRIQRYKSAVLLIVFYLVLGTLSLLAGWALLDVVSSQEQYVAQHWPTATQPPRPGYQI